MISVDEMAFLEPGDLLRIITPQKNSLKQMNNQAISLMNSDSDAKSY
jgi:hypothetical protein